MSEAAELELVKAHSAATDKYIYFLLAAAGASIAFALSQTKGAALSPWQAPLGAAVLCWAASFYSGCARLRSLSQHIYLNVELLKVLGGRHELTGQHPQLIAVAQQSTMESLKSESDAGARWATWQFRLLLLGAGLYVVWHVAEMYLRAIDTRGGDWAG